MDVQEERNSECLCDCGEGRKKYTQPLLLAARHFKEGKQEQKQPDTTLTSFLLFFSLSLLKTNHRLFLGDGAPLSSVFAALRTMGSAYVPCVLLVLSGSLAQVRRQKRDPKWRDIKEAHFRPVLSVSC